MIERPTGITSPKQLIYTLGFPLVVFFCAWWVLNNVDLVPDVYMDLFAVSPYILLLIVIALTFRFNQARVLAISLSLMVGYWGIRQFLQQPLTAPLAASCPAVLTGYARSIRPDTGVALSPSSRSRST